MNKPDVPEYPRHPKESNLSKYLRYWLATIIADIAHLDDDYARRASELITKTINWHRDNKKTEEQLLHFLDQFLYQTLVLKLDQLQQAQETHT